MNISNHKRPAEEICDFAYQSSTQEIICHCICTELREIFRHIRKVKRQSSSHKRVNELKLNVSLNQSCSCTAMATTSDSLPALHLENIYIF